MIKKIILSTVFSFFLFNFSFVSISIAKENFILENPFRVPQNISYSAPKLELLNTEKVNVTKQIEKIKPKIKKQNSNEISPSDVRAIYMTAYTAGYAERRNSLIEKVVASDKYNAVVIDIKDVSGFLAYTPKNPIRDASPSNKIKDIHSIVKQIKKRGVYLIARIIVFKDQEFVKKYPGLAVKNTNGEIWRDRKGKAWVDPSAEAIWDYTVDLSSRAYDLGFDEVNIDYVRFPSDGNMDDIVYPISGKNSIKSNIIEEFNKYLSTKLRDKYPEKKLSADVFGMVTARNNGLGIGQKLSSFIPYYDYVSPMIYPSLYPNNYNGIVHPNNHEYKIVYDAVLSGLKYIDNYNFKNGTDYPHSLLRPWIQGYTCTWCSGYQKKLVDIIDQEQAVKDNNLDGFLLWNSSNKYNI